jgi:hypothetical protein
MPCVIRGIGIFLLYLLLLPQGKVVITFRPFAEVIQGMHGGRIANPQTVALITQSKICKSVLTTAVEKFSINPLDVVRMDNLPYPLRWVVSKFHVPDQYFTEAKTRCCICCTATCACG